MTNQANKNRPLTLSEFAEAQRFRSIASLRTEEHYVAVDADENVVWCEVEHHGARERLTECMARHPERLGQWRLLVLREGEVRSVEWPCSATPRERALDLARGLNAGSVGLSATELVDFAAAYFLDAEVGSLQFTAPMPPQTVVHLAWFDTGGAPVPVGVLLGDERGKFRLLADERTPAVGPDEVKARIAQWAETHTGANVTSDYVELVVETGPQLRPPATSALVHYGLDLARRLAMLPRS